MESLERILQKVQSLEVVLSAKKAKKVREQSRIGLDQSEQYHVHNIRDDPSSYAPDEVKKLQAIVKDTNWACVIYKIEKTLKGKKVADNLLADELLLQLKKNIYSKSINNKGYEIWDVKKSRKAIKDIVKISQETNSSLVSTLFREIYSATYLKLIDDRLTSSKIMVENRRHMQYLQDWAGKALGKNGFERYVHIHPVKIALGASAAGLMGLVYAISKLL